MNCIAVLIHPGEKKSDARTRTGMYLGKWLVFVVFFLGGVAHATQRAAFCGVKHLDCVRCKSSWSGVSSPLAIRRELMQQQRRV